MVYGSGEEGEGEEAYLPPLPDLPTSPPDARQPAKDIMEDPWATAPLPYGEEETPTEPPSSYDAMHELSPISAAPPVRKEKVCVTDKVSSDGHSSKLSYSISMMQGWKPTMEDTYFALPTYLDREDWSLFGVFDGHRGDGVAKYVAQHLPSVLANLPSFRAGKYVQALMEVNHRMDALLREQLALDYAAGFKPQPQTAGRSSKKSRHPLEKAGCTAVVCLRIGSTIYVSGAGDSRAVLARSFGRAEALTNDHSPDQDVEAIRIQQAGGYVSKEGRVNGNLAVSRTIGDLDFKGNAKLTPRRQLISAEPEVAVVRLTWGDTFLILACDGIWDCRTNQQAVEFFRHHYQAGTEPMSRAIEQLMDQCVAKSYSPTIAGNDNMTLLLISFDNIDSGCFSCLRPRRRRTVVPDR